MAREAFLDRFNSAYTGSQLEIGEEEEDDLASLYSRVPGPAPFPRLVSVSAAKPKPTFRTLWSGSAPFRYGVVFVIVFVFSLIFFAVLRPRFVLNAAHVEIGDDIDIPRQEGSRYIKPTLRMSAGKLFGFSFLVAVIAVLSGLVWQLFAKKPAADAGGNAGAAATPGLFG